MKKIAMVALGILVITVALGMAFFRAPMGAKLNSYALEREPIYTLGELISKNPAVVQVSVLDAEPRYDAEDRVVYTFSRVRVDNSVIGPLQQGEEISVRIRGGKVGSLETLPDEDLPTLHPGSKHILFLEWYKSENRPQNNGWYLTARWQGRAEILPDGSLKLMQKENMNHPLKEWEGRPVGELVKAIQARKR